MNLILSMCHVKSNNGKLFFSPIGRDSFKVIAEAEGIAAL